MRKSAKLLGVGLMLAGAVAALIWYAALSADHRGLLTLTILPEGATAAAFVELPSGRELLVDGGSGSDIIRQLGSLQPFYDRSIDIVVASAPEASKVGGLFDVLSRYAVGVVIRSAARSGAPQVQSFDGALTKAQARGSRVFIVKRGDIVDLGGGAYLEVLFPDRDATGFAASDGCLAMRLLFGATSFMFSCGSSGVENYLADLDGVRLRSDVLIATGKDTKLFAGLVSPQFAVVPCAASATSSGFAALEIQTLDICGGSITFFSDGQTIVRR